MIPTSQTPLLSLSSKILLFILMTLITGSAGFSAPRFQVDEPVVNFGERRTGDQVEHSFIISNPGDDTLRISNVRASCGCTVPKSKSLKIRPGERESLPIRINLAGRKGPQNQFVTFSTNDPERPAVSLKLTGTAIPEISVEPRTLNLGHVDPDDIKTGVITLNATTGKPFKVLRATSEKDRVTLTTIPSGSGKSTEIRVQPKPTLGDGHFTDVIKIKTDHPEADSERVLVMWQVQSGITVAPSAVNLVLADRPQRLNRYLMVKGYPGLETPLEVLEVTWPGQEQVELAIMDTARFGWRIHLRSFEPRASMHESVIHIKTNAEGFETLQVPVKIFE